MSSADVPVGCRVGLPARARVQIAWTPPAYPVWRLRYRVREFTDRHFAPEACSSGIALKTEPFFRSLFSPGPSLKMLLNFVGSLRRHEGRLESPPDALPPAS